MSTLNVTFTHCLTLPADLNPEAHFLHIPAKGAVALISDADHQPFQLLHCADLRRLMRSRWENRSTDKENQEADTTLPTTPIAGPRVAYKAIARYIEWITLSTELEREITYLHHAREHFPKDASQFTRARRVHWLTAVLTHSNTTWRVTDKTPTEKENHFHLGPYPTQSSAQKTLEQMQDLFELCRYPAQLKKAPDGQPCLYKDMGRCPAPCDGTVPVEEHHQLMKLNVNAFHGAHHEIDAIWHEQMKQAAVELAFERAKLFKEKRDALPQLIVEQTDHAIPLSKRAYLIIEQGPTNQTRRSFLIQHDTIIHLGDFSAKDPTAAESIRTRLTTLRANPTSSAAVDSVIIPLLYWHCLRAKERAQMLDAFDWNQLSDLLALKPPHWIALHHVDITSH